MVLPTPMETFAQSALLALQLLLMVALVLFTVIVIIMLVQPYLAAPSTPNPTNIVMAAL